MGHIVPQNPQKALTLPHLDFGLVTTRTVREYISVVLCSLGKLNLSEDGKCYREKTYTKQGEKDKEGRRRVGR